MHSVFKRHEIQVLRKAGHTLEEVARMAGVGRSTAQRVSAEPPVGSGLSPPPGARVGRPGKAEKHREWLVAELAREPGVMTLELLRRARGEGYTGGKSAFYALVASTRPADSRLVTRFEAVPGEFTQHDFGEVQVRYVGGEVERLQFFASRMKYSRWCEVSLVPNQRAETLVRACAEHFERLGGTPLLAVFDRPRTIALRWGPDGKVTAWNPMFSAAMMEMGVAAEVCWPHAPWQKGAVENLVGWVKGSFFKPRRFQDRADLESQLATWHVEVNEQRPSRATEEVPAHRMVAERGRMRPVRVKARDLGLPVPIVVGPTAMVLHETCLYSMPPEAVGFSGTLFLYPDRVRIVAGKHRVEHPRLFGRNERTSLPEHRTARLAEVSGSRGRQYLKRQDLLDAGSQVEALITELVHQHPTSWYAEIDALHELLQQHGPGLLRLAAAMALAEHRCSAMAVAEHLARPSRRQLELPL